MKVRFLTNFNRRSGDRILKGSVVDAAALEPHELVSLQRHGGVEAVVMDPDAVPDFDTIVRAIDGDASLLPRLKAHYGKGNTLPDMSTIIEAVDAQGLLPNLKAHYGLIEADQRPSGTGTGTTKKSG